MNLRVFDMDGALLEGTTPSLEIARHLGSAERLVELEARFAAGNLDTRGSAAAIHELRRYLTPPAVADAFAASPWLRGIQEVCTDIRELGERVRSDHMSPDFFAQHCLSWALMTLWPPDSQHCHSWNS
jgi:phosphoserine phosphatase